MFFRKNRYGEKCIKFTNTGYEKKVLKNKVICVCIKHCAPKLLALISCG